MRTDLVGGDLARVEKPNRSRPRHVQDSCGLLRRHLRLGSNDLHGRPVCDCLKGGEEAIECAVGYPHCLAAADAESDGFAVAKGVERLTGEGLVGRASHDKILPHKRNKRKRLLGAGQKSRHRPECGAASQEATRTIDVEDMTPETASVALRSTRRTTIEELAAAQFVEPMVSTEEWAADDFFESDEELEAFLVDLRASRDAFTG